MAEVVGLAAGLVSLGIQVSAGITTYLDAIKCRAEDIASVKQQVRSFDGVLRSVQSALGNVDSTRKNQVSVTAITDCLASCETELKSLEVFVLKLTGSGPSQASFKDKIREQTKKLAYPFNRTELDRLQTKIARVNGILQTALQSLNLWVTLICGAALWDLLLITVV